MKDESQTDPTFRSMLQYSRKSANRVREALIIQKNYKSEELPTVRSISNILNRLDYRLRKVQKIKPLKKIKETDAIFENLHNAHKESDNNSTSLRISIDTKATVKIGKLCRGGKDRSSETIGAEDHDTKIIATLIPFGISEPNSDHLSIYFGQSYSTTDFGMDCLETWWQENKYRHKNIDELIINSDNGQMTASNRSQFIKRIVKFAQQTNLKIRMIYYPPYHSKYNAIERCWGVLENFWNGTILDEIQTAYKMASNMTWRGVNPDIKLIDTIYTKKIKVKKDELKLYEASIQRSKELPKWDFCIN